MKIRMGFVSNSSSTSFCVVGNVIKEEDIYSGKYEWNKNIIIIGGHNGDGIMVFHLTKEMYDVLVNHVETPACKDNVTFVKGTFYEGGEELGPYKNGARVYCGECTINEPDLESFTQGYLHGEDMDW